MEKFNRKFVFFFFRLSLKMEEILIPEKIKFFIYIINYNYPIL